LINFDHFNQFRTLVLIPNYIFVNISRRLSLVIPRKEADPRNKLNPVISSTNTAHRQIFIIFSLLSMGERQVKWDISINLLPFP